MTRHRLPALALIVTALVAVVALVAHGRPLAATSGHGGLPASFWDYLLTTGIIVVVLMWLGLIALAPTSMPAGPRKRSQVALMITTLLGLVVLGVVMVFFMRHLYLLHHHHHPIKAPGGGRYHHGPGAGGSTANEGRHVIWNEVAIVAGLLVLVAAIFAATRPRRAKGHWRPRTAPDAVAAALDDSLDDLRTDPDLRRAIVAAYARMESALAHAGLPRRPAEAPLEYVERALLELDLSGSSVRRLTDLFEWARFSHHEPEPSMRDEAVDALEAVRDGLRAPAEVAA